MRLFTAIDLPNDVRLRLERLLIALRPEALINWSPIDNLHITTKFIGEFPEVRLPEIHEAFASVAPREPFEIELKDLGWFPHERSPRVLWVGVHGGNPLLHLVEDTERWLEKIGLKREVRPFAPHLTLARIKNPVPLRRLRQKVEDMQPAVLGTFNVSQFALFRSDPGSNSSIYRKLREYRFDSAFAATP